jgi:VRR-NUC domain-containing protein
VKVQMRERELQDAVVDMATLLGWRVAHQRPGRTVNGWRTPIQGHAGFPDLVLLRPPRLMFVELKGTRGKVDPQQALWLNGLAHVPHVQQFVWTPKDWELGLVEEALR